MLQYQANDDIDMSDDDADRSGTAKLPQKSSEKYGGAASTCELTQAL